jgi:hypothetical protein
MTKLEIKKSETPTRTILTKVWTSEDDYSSVEFAFLNLSEELISLIKSASEEVRKLKEKFNDSVYCIEIWNYSPLFITDDVVFEIFGDDFDDSFNEFIYVDKPKEENLSHFIYELCSEKGLDTVSQDATRLAVTDDGFCFSSYLKHTNIILETKKISISELDKISETFSPFKRITIKK